MTTLWSPQPQRALQDIRESPPRLCALSHASQLVFLAALPDHLAKHGAGVLQKGPRCRA
jgi:hypothetical protein